MLTLNFGVLFTSTTYVVHVLALNAGRPLGSAGMALPSMAYAAELLAWDIWLGLALLGAAQTLTNEPSAGAAKSALGPAGLMCIPGTVGPLVRRMRWQLISTVAADTRCSPRECCR